MNISASFFFFFWFNSASVTALLFVVTVKVAAAHFSSSVEICVSSKQTAPDMRLSLLLPLIEIC